MKSNEWIALYEAKRLLLMWKKFNENTWQDSKLLHLNKETEKLTDGLGRLLADKAK